MGEFQVAVGKGAHEEHRFHAGMELSGVSFPVGDSRNETAGFYKRAGSRLKVTLELKVTCTDVSGDTTHSGNLSQPRAQTP
jgi:hypothetical protein